MQIRFVNEMTSPSPWGCRNSRNIYCKAKISDYPRKSPVAPERLLIDNSYLAIGEQLYVRALSLLEQTFLRIYQILFQRTPCCILQVYSISLNNIMQLILWVLRSIGLPGTILSFLFKIFMFYKDNDIFFFNI